LFLKYEQSTKSTENAREGLAAAVTSRPLTKTSTAKSRENQKEIMIKKLLVTAIAAGALSVPLAVVASADTGNGNGIGSGGVPGEIGGQGPGQTFSGIAQAKGPGSLPEALGIQPGQAVKNIAPTPGAGEGKGPAAP
jgi:hypothetical protein